MTFKFILVLLFLCLFTSGFNSLFVCLFVLELISHVCGSACLHVCTVCTINNNQAEPQQTKENPNTVLTPLMLIFFSLSGIVYGNL